MGNSWGFCEYVPCGRDNDPSQTWSDINYIKNIDCGPLDIPKKKWHKMLMGAREKPDMSIRDWEITLLEKLYYEKHEKSKNHVLRFDVEILDKNNDILKIDISSEGLMKGKVKKYIFESVPIINKKH